MTRETLRPVLMRCAVCSQEFEPKLNKHGGGRLQKYCSANCNKKRYLLQNPEQRKASVLKYENKEINKTRKTQKQRERRLRDHYGWTPADFEQEMIRQNYSCYGCLEPINEKTARIDHRHGENKPRGILCDSCNRGIGFLKENPSTMRRLMAYLDHDRQKQNIYLAGSMKNSRIPEIGNILRSLEYDVMDEWITPGPEADENWQKYEKLRGRTYREALYGRSATNTFLFDRSYIDLSDILVAVAPYGKSAMLELGYAKGRGKKAYILLDGKDPERYDIMPGVADEVFETLEDLIQHLKENKPWEY